MWKRIVGATLLLAFLLGAQHLSSVWGWRQVEAVDPGSELAVGNVADAAGLADSGFRVDQVALRAEGALALEGNQIDVTKGRQAAWESGLLVGVWQPGAPWDMSHLISFEEMSGTKMDIVHWYQAWGSESRGMEPSYPRAVTEHGALPMITWEPWDYHQGRDQPEYRLSRIASGKFDDYVRSWARGLKGFGQPVLLRFAHEMNHGNYPWSIGVNGNTSPDYVDAWRHVHDIFTEEGASNVQWVWSPNVGYDGTTPFEEIYPGDAYVDWIALDGYNGGSKLDWGGWQSFGQIFSASYQKLSALSSKPMMIAETGSAEEGGDKAAWIEDALTVQIPANFPRIKAVVWFNEKREADWRVNSSPSALEAFRRAVNGAKPSKVYPKVD